MKKKLIVELKKYPEQWGGYFCQGKPILKDKFNGKKGGIFVSEFFFDHQDLAMLEERV